MMVILLQELTEEENYVHVLRDYRLSFCELLEFRDQPPAPETLRETKMAYCFQLVPCLLNMDLCMIASIVLNLYVVYN